MANRSKRSGSGSGGEAATLTLLEAIRDELGGFRRDLIRGLAVLKAEIRELRGEVRQFSARTDNLPVGPVDESQRR